MIKIGPSSFQDGCWPFPSTPYVWEFVVSKLGIKYFRLVYVSADIYIINEANYQMMTWTMIS